MVDMEWPGPRQPDVPFLEVDILSNRAMIPSPNILSAAPACSAARLTFR